MSLASAPHHFRLPPKHLLLRILPPELSHKLPDDFFDEFIRSDFSYLVPQENKTSIGFSSQEEEDDYNASHPPPRNYCLEC